MAKFNWRRFMALLLLITSGTLLIESLETQAAASSAAAPPTPVFADNYRVQGLLSLPYAELNEPFVAYYDKQMQRSRTDYYGGEYKVYQFGPKSSPESAELNTGSASGSSASASSQYGSIYKLLYVPSDFHTTKLAANGGFESKAKQLLKKAYKELFDHHHGAVASKTPVKRACFGVNGGVGYTIQAQTVLPNLKDFTYDSTGRCPAHLGTAPEHKLAKCELWKYSNQVGDKKNTYKFWLKRQQTITTTGANESVAVPVHYYMLGYDSLLGSHYDRYDISYMNYCADQARDADFELDIKGLKCGRMPGPGDDNDDDNDNNNNTVDASSIRAHLVVQNPIHEYVIEPHRYDHIDKHYEQFLSDFSKVNSHGGDTRSQRQGWFNFLHNLRFIHGKNRQLKEYKLKVNKFADENVRELRYLRGRLHPTKGGYNGGLDYEQKHKLLQASSGSSGPNGQLPDNFDWTVLGGVTPVKDQAVCGSCWSFGTAGTVEGAYFAKTGKLLRLSQQQLVDCSWQFGNNGCDGGEDFRAYQYIMKAGGLATEEDYGHYKGIDGKCHDMDVNKPVKIKGFYNVTVNSVEALKHAIVNYGPVSISIDASRPTFTFYSHGAYYDDKCQNSPDSLDHSVLAVGYTKINDKLVWKVKNSWSTYWGNDGYIYMLAENNNCGVLDAPTVPIIDTGAS